MILTKCQLLLAGYATCWKDVWGVLWQQKTHTRKRWAAFVAACLLCFWVLFGDLWRYQDHLYIENTDGSTDHLVFHSCAGVHEEWGGIASSYGLMHSATFLLTARNGEKALSKIDEFVLRPQCQMTPGGHVATVYVCSSYLGTFAHLVQHIPFPFVLMSGDADITVPNDVRNYARILDSTNVLRWYTQNMGFDAKRGDSAVTEDPGRKLRPLPIGVDLHTLYLRASVVAHWGPAATPMQQVSQLADIAAKAMPFHQRQAKVYCNFHLNVPKHSYFFSDREEAEESLRALASPTLSSSSSVVFFQAQKLTRTDTWAAQTEYAFVASPHGVGLDCHRTWEAMALGSVPIVKSGPLDRLYEGLPVLLVREWADVTPALLAEKHAEFAQKLSLFASKKLSLQYWVDEVSVM